MSFSDFEKALKKASQNGGDFEGKKSEKVIQSGEIALGLEFPPTYRKFLSTLGCGDFEGQEFYGIIHDDFENSGVPDAIWLTIEERKRGFPKNLVIVFAPGDGSYFAIDTAQKSTGKENPIVVLDVLGNLKIVFDDFGEFFSATVGHEL